MDFAPTFHARIAVRTCNRYRKAKCDGGGVYRTASDASHRWQLEIDDRPRPPSRRRRRLSQAFPALPDTRAGGPGREETRSRAVVYRASRCSGCSRLGPFTGGVSIYRRRSSFPIARSALCSQSEPRTNERTFLAVTGSGWHARRL